MPEIITLFTAFFIVAFVPGPLAIVAFYGGTRGLVPFLAGLVGQLTALVIVTNLLAVLGARSGVIQQPWFPAVAAAAFIWLGYRIVTAEKKGKPADGLTFASTFMMAATNPKAILGFGPPLLFFHQDGITLSALALSSLVLVAAVSLSMVFYYILGRFLKDSSYVKYIRRALGALLILFGALILLYQVYRFAA